MGEDDLLRKLDSVQAMDVDDETAQELRSALAERGATITHEELKRDLGMERTNLHKPMRALGLKR